MKSIRIVMTGLPTLLVVLIALAPPSVRAEDAGSLLRKDPHYVEAGFFDIHVCNWNDRPNFFMVLFSTKSFNNVERIEVFWPDGRPLTELDLARYRVIKKKGKPEKRVFMQQVPLPKDATDGWYSARVTMKGGRHYLARDYVVVQTMDTPSDLKPGNESGDVPTPAALTWKPVAGASHYKVFIRDMWEGGRVIFESDMLTKPKLPLPAGLIKPGGYYAWRVHARDVNENILLGDFNHGSLSDEVQFTTMQ